MYSLSRYFGRKVQLGPANRLQKIGLVWWNRKKINQIINDYLCLPFFLLIILCLILTFQLLLALCCCEWPRLIIFCIYLLLLDSGVLTSDDGNPAASAFFAFASKLILNFFLKFLIRNVTGTSGVLADKRITCKLTGTLGKSVISNKQNGHKT